jgi:glycosyltransferase involved in cell wall biosynthesis
MRVLHVNKFLYRRGGAEGYMLDLAELQAKAGHEVAFFGMDHPENPPLPLAAHFPPHVELDLPPRRVYARVTAGARMIHSSESRRGIDAVLSRFRPDVAHLHNIYHQLSPSVLRPLVAHGVPMVMTLHDYKLACPSYQFLDHGRICEACLGGRFHHAVLRRCKDDSLVNSLLLAVESAAHRLTGAYDPVGTFVCPSEFMAGKMLAAGIEPARLRVLSHFVDLTGIEPKQEPGGPVVFAGRLAPEKGVDVLVEAIGLLGGEARLEVAGDGPERERLEALAGARAPGRVRFWGRLSKERLLELLSRASVCAIPSRWYENQPMAVLEAFACGVPVVATGLGGLPELVEPGVDGEIVPADDPATLAKALGGTLRDQERAFAMGRAGLAKMRQRFSPERHLEQLDGIYQGVGA